MAELAPEARGALEKAAVNDDASGEAGAKVQGQGGAVAFGDAELGFRERLGTAIVDVGDRAVGGLGYVGGEGLAGGGQVGGEGKAGRGVYKASGGDANGEVGGLGFAGAASFPSAERVRALKFVLLSPLYLE